MRRGNNVAGRGMPGCRDGGFKNREVSEEEFENNWKLAFGHVGPAKNTETADETPIFVASVTADGVYRFPTRGE